MTYWDTESGQFVTQTIMQENGIPLQSEKFVGYPIPYPIEQHSPEVKIKLLNERAKLPTRSNFDDAGMDFYAAETVTLHGRHSLYDEKNLDNDPARVIVSTGISIEIPQGTGLFLWDRSGMSAKSGIHRVAGVIDSSYRGELRVALVNLSLRSYDIKAGDKIIQGILAPIILPKIVQVNELSDTKRGAGGFGSTGAR